MTILLIEDEPIIVRIYKNHLEKCGHQVWCSTQLADALALNRTQQPAVILLDHGLKHDTRSGLDALPQLKQENPDAHIIIISNYKNNEIEERARKLGAIDYLVKMNTSLTVLESRIKQLTVDR